MNNKFEFNYYAPSSSEKDEIEHIRNQYLQKSDKTKKIEKLRKLDNKVKNTPTCIALVLGVVGILIFGTGLAMAIEWNILIWGIVVGIVGCIPMGFAYFVYNKVYSYLENKYRDEILSLSNDLLKDE